MTCAYLRFHLRLTSLSASRLHSGIIGIMPRVNEGNGQFKKSAQQECNEQLFFVYQTEFCYQNTDIILVEHVGESFG